MSVNSQPMICPLSELDFTDPKHIKILDQVMAGMFSGSSEERRLSEKMLTDFKDHPASWTKVGKILEASASQQSKYFALQVLEQVVTTRWKSLPRSECEGIKKYIVGLIIKHSNVSEVMGCEKMFLNKLNILLIHVVKREWPKRWESFIPDIVGSGKKNESLCLNNMVILQLLSEEVFDFSCGKMTQKKIHHLKCTLCSQFQMIFEFCIFVLENSQNAPLVEVTLQTFLKFLSWIPVGFIFETKVIDMLIFKFFDVPLFRNVTLKCLTEIAGLNAQNYNTVLTKLFSDTMSLLVQILPLGTDIVKSYNIGTDQEKYFIQNLALFLATFLTSHQEIVIDDKMETEYGHALQYMLLLTSVDELEVFKICLECWHSLFSDMYFDFAKNNYVTCTKYSLSFYTETFKVLRPILISRMVKPKEVLVVENENGEVVRERLTDTDSITLYKTMRQTLVVLANLDSESMESVIIESLDSIIRGENYSWDNLNKLCWAIGSMSGAMPEASEKNFLVHVIRNLLTLCEERKGKDNKAIIASNIMYIVGQYPRFLRSHWKFLKTVVNKLFEFMHETHDGVQDMACDTFIKITSKCSMEFVYQQEEEARPMVYEIVENSMEIVCDLQPHQAHTFYEAVGLIIKQCLDPESKQALVTQLMCLPNIAWAEIINQATHDIDVLKEHNLVKKIIIILKTNVCVCKAVTQGYLSQLNHIFSDMMKVFKVMSENINSAVTANGEAVIKQPLLKGMMSVKKEIIHLVASWLQSCEFNFAVQNQFLFPFLEIMLIDYRLVPCSSVREVEVLIAMTSIVTNLHTYILDKMPKIFDAIFESTLDMINKDMEEYPEFRTNFFLFVQAINNYCFEAFMAITPRQFKLVIDSIIWAVKHIMRDVADIGLEILMQLLVNIERFPEAAQSFYQMYFTEILQHVFSVVTDSSQAAGLDMHATILSRMFLIVENGCVSAPLSTGTNIPADNITYIQGFVVDLLKSAYPHLTDHQIKVVVQGFFNLNENVAAFKEHLQDFLVQIREYTGEDDCDLFLDEREEELKKIAEEKRRLHMTIPGIVGPHECMDIRSG